MILSSLSRAALLFLGLAACGGSGGYGGSTGPNYNPNGNPSNNSNTVSVSNNVFTPASKTVPLNTTVQWTWSNCPTAGNYGEDVCASHSVTFDDGTDSGIKNSGSYSRTFTQVGTYPYHCVTHGAAMSGTITVQ